LIFSQQTAKRNTGPPFWTEAHRNGGENEVKMTKMQGEMFPGVLLRKSCGILETMPVSGGKWKK